MISNLAITTHKVELDRPLKTYISKKIAALDRFLPRHARQSVHGQVILRQVNRAHGNKYEVEVILHVPHSQLTAKDSTLNLFAAVDIVEAKLKSQLKKYKDTRAPSARARGRTLLRQLSRRLFTSQPQKL